MISTWEHCSQVLFCDLFYVLSNDLEILDNRDVLRADALATSSMGENSSFS